MAGKALAENIDQTALSLFQNEQGFLSYACQYNKQAPALRLRANAKSIAIGSITDHGEEPLISLFL